MIFRRRRWTLLSLAFAFALAASALRGEQRDDPPSIPEAPSEEPASMPPETVSPDAPAPSASTTDSTAPKPSGREQPDQGGADPGDPNPCRPPRSFKEAWLDKVRRGVFYTVCGSAAWFDNFFGDEHEYDPRQVYGRLSAGMLYDAEGEWNERSKFDANVPLPNLSKRTSAFLGRDNPEQFISDSSQDLATPEAFRETSDERSWLAGFGYNPPGRRGSKMSYRLGMKVSSHPYAFAQARYRYNHYTDHDTAFRFNETIFYRTNDDQFGATTYLGYDWIPRRANLARISAQGTVSEDTDGLKWKSYATFYHDLELSSGKPRGVAYQLLANGETAEDVPLREYGFLTIYREQLFRQWFFAEVSLGYSWVRESLDEQREGGVTVGFVFEILFGDYYDRR
ncbi:MAG: hypothetical protein HYU52_01185 [Acidobacteria bacterium]|nr:hypothetical protein [Acidobacteriota bacterium]